VIERAANDGGMTHADRHELRQKKSLPIVAELRAWLDLHVDKHPPKSPLGRAVAYADGQWEFFARCFSRGDFEIDNGECERQIRILALGRKNFLFSGSVDAADRLCAAYTLVVGAKRNNLDPFEYIRDLLTKLERGFPVDRLSELTPTKWRRQ
jgi:transposase